MAAARVTTKEENERQYRVLDQMLSMHSSLRDRLERRAFWLNTGLIASSLFLCVFAFVGDDVLTALGLDPALTRFTIGLSAVVVLVFSITEFRVDWRSVAGRHAEAAIRLAQLKAKYRKSFDETVGNDPKKNARLAADYEKTTGTLPAIPDRWFNTLKAEHRFKRTLSERLSQCPKAPVWFLRLQICWEGIREARHAAKDRQNEPPNKTG